MSPLRPPEDTPRLVEARCVYEDCGRRFTYDPSTLEGSSFPFCSPRCKGADLGNWVNESYRIPGMPDLRGLDDEDEDEAEPQRPGEDEEDDEE